MTGHQRNAGPVISETAYDAGTVRTMLEGAHGWVELLLTPEGRWAVYTPGLDGSGTEAAAGDLKDREKTLEKPVDGQAPMPDA